MGAIHPLATLAVGVCLGAGLSLLGCTWCSVNWHSGSTTIRSWRFFALAPENGSYTRLLGREADLHDGVPVRYYGSCQDHPPLRPDLLAGRSAAMKTHRAGWELLTPDLVRLTALVTSHDRLVQPEEVVPARARAERELGQKVLDCSPERRN